VQYNLAWAGTSGVSLGVARSSSRGAPVSRHERLTLPSKIRLKLFRQFRGEFAADSGIIVF